MDNAEKGREDERVVDYASGVSTRDPDPDPDPDAGAGCVLGGMLVWLIAMAALLVLVGWGYRYLMCDF